MGPFWAPAEPLSASYRIDVRIDPAGNAVTGTETVTLVNRSSRPLAKLALVKGLGKQATLSLRINGQQRRITPSPEELAADAPAVVALPGPLGPGEAVVLQISFSGPVPETQYGPEGRYGAIMLADWHPRLWWGYPTHDDFEVRVYAPEGWQVVATGRSDGPEQPWRAAGVRSFGIVLVRDLEVMEGRAGDVLVRCLFEPGWRQCAELLLATAVDAIKHYRSEFGFYPQPSLSIVPGMDRPVGGCPFATGIVCIHGPEQLNERPTDHWRWITAHEIGHQYWGEHVLEADAPGWLWIGLGIYMDREYSRARGLDPGIHRGLMDRYLDGVQEGVDTTVERPPEQLAEISFDHNNIVVHGKGFAIISALESVLGRDVFRGAFDRCLAEYGGRRLGAWEFQRACEQEAGQDLSWFFDQWLRSNRYLAYRIASVEKAEGGGRHRTEATVERVGTLDMPIPVEARFEDGSVQRAATERLVAATKLTFESAAAVREVVLDPDGVLPLLQAPVSGLAREVARLPWTGAGERARALFERARDLGLSSDSLWGKLGVALYDGAFYAEALAAFEKAAASADGMWRPVGLVWQGHVLDLLGRREEALGRYREAREVGIPRPMQHDQYGIIIDARWIEERLKTPFQREEKEGGS